MSLPLKGPPKTILAVEDAAAVLSVVREILEDANFNVLAAANAGEAIRLAGLAKTVDLLLSDVMMPDMSGPDLATKLKASRPEMRVILMSGYPGGEILILNHGWHFIQKPFVPVELVAKVRQVLDEKINDQGSDQFDTRK